MRARDVMSHPVVAVRPHLPVRAAAAQLVTHGFTSAPVVDAEGRMYGIVTEADLMRGRIFPEGWVVEERHETPVREVMRPVTGMPPDTDLGVLAAHLLETGARSVPIVEDGRLVGIVTRRDLLRVVADPVLTAADAVRPGR